MSHQYFKPSRGVRPAPQWLLWHIPMRKMNWERRFAWIYWCHLMGCPKSCCIFSKYIKFKQCEYSSKSFLTIAYFSRPWPEGLHLCLRVLAELLHCFLLNISCKNDYLPKNRFLRPWSEGLGELYFLANHLSWLLPYDLVAYLSHGEGGAVEVIWKSRSSLVDQTSWHHQRLWRWWIILNRLTNCWNEVTCK